MAENCRYYAEGYCTHWRYKNSRCGYNEKCNYFEEEETSSTVCYLATCVYKSYDKPQVCVLRRFRDDCLSKTKIGRATVYTYYKIAPKLIKHFGNNKIFNKIVKSILDRFVKYLIKRGYNATPYRDTCWECQKIKEMIKKQKTLCNCNCDT